MPKIRYTISVLEGVRVNLKGCNLCFVGIHLWCFGGDIKFVFCNLCFACQVH